MPDAKFDAQHAGRGGFAAVLASLTTQGRRGAVTEKDDEPTADVSALSYESALLAHGRYRSRAASDESLTRQGASRWVDPPRAVATNPKPKVPQVEPEPEALWPLEADSYSPSVERKAKAQPAADEVVTGKPEEVSEARAAATEAVAKLAEAQTNVVAQTQSLPTHEAAIPFASPKPAPDADLRKSSVTIRLSRQEAELLRRRSVEAGITISAYLRSCIFETESLRASVKTTLAELKAAKDALSPPEPPRRGLRLPELLANALPRRGNTAAATRLAK